MSDYKWTNADNTSVLKYPNTHIVEGGNGWDEFQKYFINSGQVDPWKTDDEIFQDALSLKLDELQSERDTLVNSSVGSEDIGAKLKKVSRAVKLLKKKYEGRASSDEIQELDDQEAIDDFIESVNGSHSTAEIFLKDNLRTLEEVESFNVSVDPIWPVWGA